MMGPLAGRAEAISGEFRAQDVANALWAFASMGRKPGERMMGQLERRAEAISGELNSQDVATMLWSMCFFCTLSSDLQGGLHSFLVFVASRLDSQFFAGLNSQDLSQLHQFFIACGIEDSLGLRLPVSIYALKAELGPACKAAFHSSPAQPSASQQQVSDTLRGMGLSVQDEFQCPKSGYSIDMRVQDKRADFGVGWAIEFDGPSHFLACKSPTGATLIKRRHLELLGYILVSVPYWEWGGLSGMDERRKYLQGKLQCNVGVDSAAHSRQAAGRHRACTQAGGGVVGAAASGGGEASESVGLSESNALGLIKPDTEQAKIDGHLEQQRRKAETSPSGGAAAGATAPATILIKSAWQKGPPQVSVRSEAAVLASAVCVMPPAAVSQDAWKERSRAPNAFSEASRVADTDSKEGYLNESATSATHSPEGWAIAKSKGKRRG
jgi:hypothetical protein